MQHPSQPILLFFCFIIATIGCNGDKQPLIVQPGTSQKNIQKISYVVFDSEGNDCLEGGCDGRPPLSTCHFATNLGSLAIVEFLEAGSISEPVHCEDQILFKYRIRVWAVAAGQPLRQEIDLYDTGGILSSSKFQVGEHGLIQLREINDLPFAVSSIKISLDSIRPLVELTENLPDNFDDLINEASRIENNPDLECQNPKRFTEQEWENFNFGDPEDCQSIEEGDDITDCNVPDPPECCLNDSEPCM